MSEIYTCRHGVVHHDICPCRSEFRYQLSAVQEEIKTLAQNTIRLASQNSALEDKIQKMREALEKIVGLCDSYGDIPMPESTFACGVEAKQALEESK